MTDMDGIAQDRECSNQRSYRAGRVLGNWSSFDAVKPVPIRIPEKGVVTNLIRESGLGPTRQIESETFR